MKKLILTMGLPRSGKSTWAAKEGHPVVSPDAIRLALHGQRFVASAEPFVWATAYLMVEALLGAGHEQVIVDACNISAKRISEWSSRYGAENIEIVTFPSSPKTCKERALATNRPELVAVIERMVAECDIVPSPFVRDVG